MHFKGADCMVYEPQLSEFVVSKKEKSMFDFINLTLCVLNSYWDAQLLIN